MVSTALPGPERLVRPAPLPGQLARFALVGAAGVLAYVAVDQVLRLQLGSQSASVLARLLVAVVTTVVNLRVTFHAHRTVPQVLVMTTALLLVGVVLTSLALDGEQVLFGASRAAEVVALVAAQLAAAGCRFVVLRHWAACPRERLT